jgi:predicted aspartyl protease
MPLRLQRLPATFVLAIALPLGGCASMGGLAITAHSPLQWNGHNRIELPLALDSVGRPIVPARIMGHETMVLVDSGGGWPSMTQALAAATGVQVSGTASINGGTYESAADVPLQLGSGTIELHKVAIGPQTMETQFALGPELFLQAVVDMDFDAGRMTLLRPGAGTPSAADALPVQLVQGKPTVQLRVNGRQQQVCAILDTGFNSGVALTSEVLGELALPQLAGHTMLTGFGGVRWQVPALAPLQQVEFGAQSYRDIPITEKKSGGEWDCPNLLGMAVLSHHRVIFDLQHRRVWLLPRSGGILSQR